MGSAIHVSSGFYFRHDSIKNPEFEDNLVQYDNRQKVNRDANYKKTKEEIEKLVIQKFEF